MRPRPSALLAALALLAGACAGSTDTRVAASPSPTVASPIPEEPTGEPSPEESPSPSEEPPPEAVDEGGAVDLADGVSVAFSRDGTHALVLQELAETGGCEDGPSYALRRVELSTGEAKPALADGSETDAALVRGPGGVVALVGQCEGFLYQLQVGLERADGLVSNLQEVDTSELGEVAPWTLRWTADGSALTVVASPFDPRGTAVVVIDPGTGAAQEAFRRPGVFQAEQLADRRFVIADEAGVHVLADDPAFAVERSYVASEFTVGPDGRLALLDPEVGLVAVAVPGEDEQILTDDLAWNAGWSGDGAWLTYMETPDDTHDVVRIGVVPTDGSAAPSYPVEDAGFGQPHLDADGGRLLFTREEPTDDFFGRPVAALLGLG